MKIVLNSDGGGSAVLGREFYRASTPPPRILCSSMTAAGMSVNLHHSTSDELGGEGRKGMLCSSVPGAHECETVPWYEEWGKM